MEPTLDQQAQQWLARRKELQAERRQAESYLIRPQWRQTPDVNPNLLPEPLRTAANKLLDQQVERESAVNALHDDDVERLAEQFESEMAEMEKLLLPRRGG